MKKIIALLLAVMLALPVVGLAEQAPSDGPSSGAPAGFPGGFPGGTPPEGFPGGTMPDGFPGGEISGGFLGGNPPEGFPGGDGESFGGPAGGFPGFGGGQAEGQIGSWSGGGTNADTVEGNDYAYDAALYVTADGIDENLSAQDRITGGTWDVVSADGITLTDSTSGHNGIIVLNAPYTISNAVIEMDTDADGTDTCDFSGKGTAIAAFGSDAHVTVTDSTVHTSGVAVMPLFADDGAVLTVKNSTMRSDGGTLYREYLNTPSQSLMVAPPWILGIMGTSRCSNLMGNNTTMNVLDSDTSAGAWAVLSTDSGSNMALNVYNSTLTLNNADESTAAPIQAEGGQITETLDNPYTVNFGSGYGTFAIGSAQEVFGGAKLNVGTYATILTGGSLRFFSLKEGETYQLTDAAGTFTGEYTATTDQPSVITSDTFGFMAHQNQNTVTLEQGTELNTGDASFLIKTGYSNQQFTAIVDGTKIVNSGVLIQVMDNDDATNGGMMATDDPANTNGGVQNFKPVHTEESGFKTEKADNDGSVQSFTFTNGEYSGSIYNASGADGLKATTLNVTLGQGAVLNGAAASTSAVHVTYEGSATIKENGGFAFDDPGEAAAFAAQYQNTSFTIDHYFDIGHVANLICDNGGNQVNVTLTDDAVWHVTGTSVISTLAIEGNASVVIPEGVTLTVAGMEYTATTLTGETVLQ